MTYPYDNVPPAFPGKELEELGNLLTSGGTALNTPEDIRAACVILDYICATFVPVPTPGPGPIKATLLSHVQLGNVLLSANKATALPWGQMWQLVSAMVAAWIAAHGG